MHIYLAHELHGRKVAIAEEEAVEDEKNGWKRYNPDTPSGEVEAAPANSLASAPTTTQRRRRTIN